MTKYDEIRSEKIRAILDTMPKALVRWGIIITILIATALVVAVCFLTFPYSNGETILQHVISAVIK